MRNRPSYRLRNALAATAVSVLAALALTGCQPFAADGSTTAGSGESTSGTTSESDATPRPTPSSGGFGDASGEIPDVCTLLSSAEVSALTGGREVLQVDEDGNQPGETVRHCQWQLSGARLAIQLSPTTEAEFGQDHPGSEPVDGVGDAAHSFSGHLFVRAGAIQVDVFATSHDGSAAERQLAKNAAAKVIDRL